MRPTLSIVVAPGVSEEWANYWHVAQLATVLTEAGVSVTKVTATLQDAPDSWAYLYLPTWLEEVTEPAATSRFPRTVAMLTVRQACAEAEKYGLAGAIDDLAIQAYDRHHLGENQVGASMLVVRRDIAKQLGWSVYELNSSPKYACTEGVVTAFAKALLAYLEALLGPPA